MWLVSWAHLLYFRILKGISPCRLTEIGLSMDIKDKVKRTGTKISMQFIEKVTVALQEVRALIKGDYLGNIRIDPAPRWNRTNDAILVPGISENKTRQMFMIEVKKKM